MADLLLSIDPELDRAFATRFERALDDLAISHADETATDPDPEAKRLPRLALFAAHRADAPSSRADTVVVVAGPAAPDHDAPYAPGALRLEASDIDARTRRWTLVAERLGQKLGRPGLPALIAAGDDTAALAAWAIAHPTDRHAATLSQDLSPASLHAQLALERQRAEAAELRLANLDRDHSHALRQTSDARRTTEKDSDHIRRLEAENQRLSDLVDHAAYGLAHAPADLRNLLTSARDHALRARLAAARADAAADDWPDALIWSKQQARYAGETKNGAPHGHGVMTFLDGALVVATYRGQFDDGARAGHGVAIADDGCVWSGQWSEDNASGLGVLDLPDGRRFEGEVAPGPDGPREQRGFTWNGAPQAAPVHAPVPPLLNAPR